MKVLLFFYRFALLILVLLLYWSSTLAEKDLKKLKSDVEKIQNRLEEIARAPQMILSENGAKELKSESSRPHIDSSLPNLLQDDPFFKKTLPELLGKDFKPHGIRHEALLGRPDNLHPFNAFRNVSSLVNMCNISVAELQFGAYEKFVPGAAIKIEERDSKSGKEYWVHLRDNLFWQPLKHHFAPTINLAPHSQKKHPITSADFKFFFDVIMNPNVSEAKAASLRNYFGDIEDFRIIDEKTFAVRWKAKKLESGETKVKYAALGLTASLQPLACFVFQYTSDGKKIIEEDLDPDTYRKNSVFAQNFSEHFAKNLIVSSGAWIFDGMTEEGITFRRNPDHYNPYAVLVEKLHYTFRQTTEVIWQDFKAGNIDLCIISPNQLPELGSFLKCSLYQDQKSSKNGICSLDFVDQAYSYIGWNEKSVYFNDVNVRRAMTMAIDRNRIIAQNLNDMGVPITGPFFRYSPSYDETIEAYPFDPQEAKKLLDQAGWIDLDGDGIRDKEINGQRVPFRFTLIYYAKNLSTKVIAEYVVTALKEVGVDCRLNGLDIADLSAKFDDKKFDAIFLGWALGTPPEDPKQLWHSKGANEKGSSNAVGFANKEADDLIEALLYEYDPEKRNEIYHKFHKLIREEEPYTFIYSPKSRILYREYVKNLFIPRDHPELVPDVKVSEPDLRIIYIDKVD